MELKSLYEKRARVYTQMQDRTRNWKEQTEKGEQLNKDEEVEFDKWSAEFDDLTAKIQRLEKFEQIENNEKAQKEEKAEEKKTEKREFKDAYKEAFGKYLREGLRGLSNDDIDLLEQRKGAIDDKYIVNPSDKRAADATSTTTTAGGYGIPEDFSYEVEKFMAYYGPFGQAGPNAPFRDWVSTTGAAMPWPTIDDTANSGELLSESGDATTNSTGITWGTESLGAYAFSSNVIPITRQILQDNAFMVDNLVQELLGERLGRVKNTYCTTGTGNSQPEGFIIGATSGKTAASQTAFTFQEVIDLVYSVNKAYRSGPKVGFQMNPSTVGYIRKLDFSSTTNYQQPVWQPSLQAGVPDRILGYPYWENADMDSALTTGKKLVAFGDFNKFVIRRVAGIQFLRSEDRYFEKLQIALLGWMRFDSIVMNTNAIKYLELS